LRKRRELEKKKRLKLMLASFLLSALLQVER
jgi:hypothetical protein